MPELERLLDGCLGVIGHIGRAFERDEAVASVAAVVGRSQERRGLRDVVKRQREEQRLRVIDSGRAQLAQLAVVAI